MKRLSPLLLLAVLAGCTAPRDPEAERAARPDMPAEAASPAAPALAPPTQAPPPASEPPPAQACNADAAAGVVGAVATGSVVEQARVQAGAAIARTLAPGQVVTMEYRGDRLNLMVDEANVVTGMRCG